jgi:ferric-dicitrate binding protein FerR (iron transport regulator)
MADDQIDWERLDRYVRGEGSRSERAELARWVDGDPKRRALADAMRTVGALRPGRGSGFDAARALRRIQPRTTTPRGAHKLQLTLLPETRRSRFVRRSIFVAGVAVAVVSGDALSRIATRSRSESESPPREIITSAGQRATLDLGDGTRVSLSPKTRLRYAADFGRAGAMRELWVDGEATFTVHHDSARSFVVHTPYGSAEDLGTEFVVSTYPEVSGMRLAVREGRVAIRAARDSATGEEKHPREPDTLAVLEPGDVARLSGTGALELARGRNVEELFAGARGALVFTSMPLRDAIPQLERWYAIRVRVSDRALMTRRISGTFRAESATEALGIIAIALGGKAEWQDNQVTLTPGHDRGDDP